MSMSPVHLLVVWKCISLRLCRDYLHLRTSWSYQKISREQAEKEEERHMEKPVAYKGKVFLERSYATVWSLVIEPLWQHSRCISAEAESDMPSCSENGRSWALPTFLPRGLSDSFCRRLLILSVLTFTLPILPLSPRWCTLLLHPLPLSSLTTSDFISHSHLPHTLVLFLSHFVPYSCSPFSAVSVGVKRISGTERGSKALNDGIEF